LDILIGWLAVVFFAVAKLTVARLKSLTDHTLQTMRFRSRMAKGPMERAFSIADLKLYSFVNHGH
jgi:hypothetical protein